MLKYLILGWLGNICVWVHKRTTLMSVSCFASHFLLVILLWPRKGSRMKTQTQILDNRLCYTRKRVTEVSYCSYNTDSDLPSGSKIPVLITVRRVHYIKMGKVPTAHTSIVCEMGDKCQCSCFFGGCCFQELFQERFFCMRFVLV